MDGKLVAPVPRYRKATLAAQRLPDQGPHACDTLAAFERDLGRPQMQGAADV